MPLPVGDRRAALLLALAGFATLSCGDAVVKSMAGAWPGTAIAALRYLFGVGGLGAILFARAGKAGFVAPLPWVQLARGTGVGVATFGFFMAVHAMPLADATAITFTSPMITAMLSAMLLGERAPRSVWVATALAFAGVLVVLRPEVFRLGPAALYPLLSAGGMAVMMTANRRVAGSASPLQLQFLIAAVAAPLLLLFAGLGHLSGLPQFHLSVPGWTVVARCALVAASATTAHWLIFLATTRASAAAVAPMTYVQLIIATAIGWAVFHNAPDLTAIGGAALIVTGGLYLWRAQPVRAAAIPTSD